MSEQETAARYQRQANRLGKWRVVLTGWVLGTRSDTDPRAAGMRDLQEARLLMRAELSAVANVLIKKGVVTAEEWTAALADECEFLNEAMAGRFPGIRATDDGLDMKMPEALETMRRLGFPP